MKPTIILVTLCLLWGGVNASNNSIKPFKKQIPKECTATGIGTATLEFKDCNDNTVVLTASRQGTASSTEVGCPPTVMVALYDEAVMNGKMLAAQDLIYAQMMILSRCPIFPV